MKQDEDKLDSFLKVTKIGFYLFMTALMIVMTLSFVRTMNAYKNVDINEALDKVASIAHCQVKYVNGGEVLYFDMLCADIVDIDETYKFLLNMTQEKIIIENKNCPEYSCSLELDDMVCIDPHKYSIIPIEK